MDSNHHKSQAEKPVSPFITAINDAEAIMDLARRLENISSLLAGPFAVPSSPFDESKDPTHSAASMLNSASIMNRNSMSRIACAIENIERILP